MDQKRVYDEDKSEKLASQYLLMNASDKTSKRMDASFTSTEGNECNFPVGSPSAHRQPLQPLNEARKNRRSTNEMAGAASKAALNVSLLTVQEQLDNIHIMLPAIKKPEDCTQSPRMSK